MGANVSRLFLDGAGAPGRNPLLSAFEVAPVGKVRDNVRV